MTKRIWHVGNGSAQEANEEQPLLDAILRIDGAEAVSHLPRELSGLSCDAFEKLLQWADVIVLDNVQATCVAMDPQGMLRETSKTGYVTFPDRFNLLRDWIEAGGHFHINGGWHSFSGQFGKGGWGRSRLADVLPVGCLEGDDLYESTEGFSTRVNQPDHPALAGIDFSSLPPLLGFNETRPRTSCGTIIDIEFAGRWHPLFAAHQIDLGRVTVWTSGALPHWGINFVRWPDYARFWNQVFTAND